MNVSTYIYETDATDKYRFTLGMAGRSMLAVIGANPSTATPENPDRTVNRIQKIARAKGFDGWIVFNLWPERQTHPEELRKRYLRSVHARNLTAIEQVLHTFPVLEIWAAWGTIIEQRPYLGRCCRDILHLRKCTELPWIQLDPPTKMGHPRHPLYSGTDCRFIPFHPKVYEKQHL